MRVSAAATQLAQRSCTAYLANPVRERASEMQRETAIPRSANTAVPRARYIKYYRLSFGRCRKRQSTSYKSHDQKNLGVRLTEMREKLAKVFPTNLKAMPSINTRGKHLKIALTLDMRRLEEKTVSRWRKKPICVFVLTSSGTFLIFSCIISALVQSKTEAVLTECCSCGKSL